MRSAILAILPLLFMGCAGGLGVDAGAPGDREGVSAVEVRVKDAMTGKPVTECRLLGIYAVDVRGAGMPSEVSVAPSGVHRFELSPMTGKIRLGATGYPESWSNTFTVRVGETTSIDLTMEPLSRITVAVLDERGAPIESGMLMLLGAGPPNPLVVKDGEASLWTRPGVLQLVVTPQLMPGYRARTEPIELRRGKHAEVTLRLVRAP